MLHYDGMFFLQVVWGKSNSDLPYMWESMADSEESTLFELGDAAGLANFQVLMLLLKGALSRLVTDSVFVCADTCQATCRHRRKCESAARGGWILEPTCFAHG